MSGLIGCVGKTSQILSEGVIKNMGLELSKRCKKVSAIKDDGAVFLNGLDELIGKNSKGYLFKSQEGLIINFEGRLDNKDEIIKKLGLDINPFLNNAEITLMSYLKWGKNCVTRFVGAFVFSIYDRKDKSLIIFRDHLGVKPLYFLKKNQSLTYASEPRFILNNAEYKKVLNKNKLEDYLLGEDRYFNETFFKDINKLPKGHFLTFREDKVEVKKYFEFQKKDYLNFKNEEDYSDLFYSTFQEVVRSMMGASNKLGTTLSGGLDSSSVTAMLLENNLRTKSRREIFSYTLGFKDLDEEHIPGTNELSFAEDMAKKEGLNSKIIMIKRRDVLKDLFKNQASFPGPVDHGNRYIERKLINACKKDGVDVIFTGFDGDSTISYGFERISELVTNWNLIEAIKEHSLVRKRSGLKRNYWVTVKNYILYRRIPLSIDYLVKKKKGLMSFRPHFAFLSDEVLDQLNLFDLVRERRREMFNFDNGHLDLLNGNKITKSLETLDIDYSYSGIEERHPFCDRRLMELCLRIPPSQKLNNGYTRYILRNSLKPILPESIQSRMTKANISPYFYYSLEKNKKELIQNLLDTNTPIIDYLDKKFLRSALKQDYLLSEEQKSFLVYLNSANKWLASNGL